MKRSLAPLVALTFALALSGCSATASASGTQNETTEVSTCVELLETPFQSNAPQPQHSHYNVLIELTSNSTDNLDQILERVQPFIECAVNTGAYLHVTVDGGEGTSLLTPDGLDGITRLSIDRVNATREAKDKREKVDQLVASIRGAMSSAQIGQYGSAQRLLNYASTLSADAATEDSSYFILWSPLLGTSADGTDCLDVSHVEPTESNATAIVKRCLDQGLIQSIPNSGAQIYGAATGSHERQQQRFADYLKQQVLTIVFGVEQGQVDETSK